MREFDHSDLDGHLLQLLLAVVEEGSITRAAHRLGVTQSAVSHLLDKLRAIVGDPLFVKSGRGIVPTARALALAAQARLLLEDMRRFVTPEQFDEWVKAHRVEVKVPGEIADFTVSDYGDGSQRHAICGDAVGHAWTVAAWGDERPGRATAQAIAVATATSASRPTWPRA